MSPWYKCLLVVGRPFSEEKTCDVWGVCCGGGGCHWESMWEFGEWWMCGGVSVTLSSFYMGVVIGFGGFQVCIC